jgi:hypothetical protein
MTSPDGPAPTTQILFFFAFVSLEPRVSCPIVNDEGASPSWTASLESSKLVAGGTIPNCLRANG